MPQESVPDLSVAEQPEALGDKAGYIINAKMFSCAMVSICCSRFFDGGSQKIVLLHHFTAAAQFLKMDTSPHESPPTLLEKDTFGLQIAGPPLSHMFLLHMLQKKHHTWDSANLAKNS